jgi:hypothetical protein
LPNVVMRSPSYSAAVGGASTSTASGTVGASARPASAPDDGSNVEPAARDCTELPLSASPETDTASDGKPVDESTRSIRVSSSKRESRADERVQRHGQRLHDSHTPGAVAERVAAPSKHSYLKDFIYGAIDGSVTTFAVVAGSEGAGLSSGIVS